jgi:ribulose-phosphate 3-epimerase
MKKIAASLLSADFARLAEEIRAVEDAGVDWLHVDVMDGHFVPNLTVGPPVIEKIKKVSKRPLDVHLMITNADHTLEDYIKAGADLLSVHVEACPHLHRTLSQIRKLGARPSVAVNPHTPLDPIGYILDEVDMVLLMSVNPGFGGQSLIPAALRKASELKKIREDHKLKFLIEMDGGIKTENISQVSEAGVDVFVVGSGLFQTADYRTTLEQMRKNMGPSSATL